VLSKLNPDGNIARENISLSSQSKEGFFTVKQFHTINARLDCMEAAINAKLDRMVAVLDVNLNEIRDEINNGNHTKDIPLTKFFSRLCELKAMDQNHPTAVNYEKAFNRFFEYMDKKYPKVKNINELTLIMMSGFIKWLKAAKKKTGNKTDKLADTSINGYIKCLRHALETVDKVGTQELRAHLRTIRKPRRIKNPYIPSDEELARIPKVLMTLRNSESEETKYLAFVGATVAQFCGRTKALSRLRFDMIEENGDNKPVVSYVGKHQVEQDKGLTNEWYRNFLKEWKKYVQKKYDNTQYFFPRRRNGDVDHLTDEQFRMKFKEVMKLCVLPRLTVQSFRYIYATKLYLMGVSPDDIKDILGVDKRTLRFYIKATQERRKKVQYEHLEKVSALPK